MSFPRCKHAKKKRSFTNPLLWLGSEPFRLFFLTGILFGIAGVMMWPLFYQGRLAFYPGINHAHIMIQAFGGAFVIGFLGTAGPRILTAPRIKPWELVPLFVLHVASGVCHLRGLTAWGDRLFLVTLAAFILALATRVIFFRKNLPPPPLLLAATGLLCGLAGTAMWSFPALMSTPALYQLSGLLLNQGFLLGPVMGVGIFLFPRLLGNDFGEPEPGAATRKSWRNMSIAAVALLASFPLEVWGNHSAGLLLRTAAFIFAISHVRWIGEKGSPKVGTLANALRFCCIPLAITGLAAPVYFIGQRIALEHLLFIGGFGLVILIAASRVLFGHSGSVERFANRSWIARGIVFATVLAALTRASADFLPRVTISHYKYAAWSWATAAGIWLLWHAFRFFKKDDDPN
ncbi:MAG: NnrS family protein [Luteolibacter sp.]